MSKGALFLVGYFVFQTAFAEDFQVSNLPRIDIFSEGEQGLLREPGSGAILNSQQIQRSQPVSAQDAIKQVSGVHVVETDGFGLFPRVAMRGLSPDMSRKVLLLEDGVPIHLGPYTDASTYYMPPIERMSGVEILKGASTLRYGPSTVGGAINFQTRNPPLTPKAVATLKSGNLGLSGGELYAGGKFENSEVLLNLNRMEGDGNRENNRFSFGDAMVKFGTHLSDKHHISLKWTRYQLEAQATYRGLTQSEFEDNPFQNPADADEISVERTGMDFNHLYAISDSTTLRTLIYQSEATRNWWRQNLNNTTLALQAGNRGRLRGFQVAGIDSRLDSEFLLGGLENSASVGVRFHTEEMTNVEIDGATKTARSGVLRRVDPRSAEAATFYFQNTVSLTDKTSLYVGSRFESYSQRRTVLTEAQADVNVAGNTSQTVVVPGFGLSHLVGEKSQIFLGAHRGYAPPSVQDSIDIDGMVSELDAESSDNIEIGFKSLGNERFDFEITAFQMNFSNQVIAATESAGTSGFPNTNAGRTLHRGLETAGKYRLASWNSDFSFSYTYLPVAEISGDRFLGGSNVRGNRLTYAPEHVLSLGAGTEIAGVRLQIDHLFVSEQFSDLQNTQEGSANGTSGAINPYGVWNLSAQADIDERFKIIGSVRNLTDEVYIASRAPRGIFTGLRRTFFIGLQGSI